MKKKIRFREKNSEKEKLIDLLFIKECLHRVPQ